MAHYAFIDENNIVVDVITGIDEGTDDINWEEWYGNFRGQTCKRTSYNTHGNQHLLDGTPFRGNHAEVGGTYDPVNDVFIGIQPVIVGKTFVLNETTWLWEEVIE